jgi:diadenosine tetraphosphate (Ap4A) HIT family hydrolase
MQRAKDRNRWLDSLYNNYSDHGVDSLRCSYFTGHFDKETKSVQVAQNRTAKWLDSLPFKIESWTSIVEYDQYGLTHCHIVLKADKSVLNHGINYLHDELIKSWPYGKAHAGRIYNLEGLGLYMMMSQTSKATSVKQAVKDEQQAKDNYNNIKDLQVPAGIKNKAKKEWRQSHMEKKKAVAKAYEKRSDKVMRKSYGQNHGVKVRCCRQDVWAFIAEHGRYQGSTTTRITSIDEWGNEHLINVVKRDIYRLNDADTRELQRLLGAVKAYQNAVKAVA